MYDQQTADMYRAAGLGQRAPRGKRPGIVVIDLQRGFTEPEYPTGADLSGVVRATNTLIAAGRPHGIPVIFTVIAYTPAEIASSAYAWFGKSSGLASLESGAPTVELDPRMSNEAYDVVLEKKGASGFFGTNLATNLVSFGVDTLIVCGTTTSGCVRATAVDALQSGFNVLVPKECVGDRTPGPHDASLFDIDEKYGDVISLDDAVDYLSSLNAAAD
jgi:maleamate amidohydrolase